MVQTRPKWNLFASQEWILPPDGHKKLKQPVFTYKEKIYGLLGDPVVKTPHAGVWGSTPDQGAGSHMPQLGGHMPQLKVLHAARKMEDLCTTTKSWHSQINENKILKKEKRY